MIKLHTIWITALFAGCLAMQDAQICSGICSIQGMEPRHLAEPFTVAFVPLAFGGEPGYINVFGSWVLWMDGMEFNRLGNRTLMPSGEKLLALNKITGALHAYTPPTGMNLLSPTFEAEGVVLLAQFYKCQACTPASAWGNGGLENLTTIRWHLQSNISEVVSLPTGRESLILESSGNLRLIQFAAAQALFSTENAENERLALWNTSTNNLAIIPTLAPAWTEANVTHAVAAGFHGGRVVVSMVNVTESGTSTIVTSYSEASDSGIPMTNLPFAVNDAFPTRSGMYYWWKESLFHDGLLRWNFTPIKGTISFSYSTQSHIVWIVESDTPGGRSSLYVHSLSSNKTTMLGREWYGPDAFPDGSQVYGVIWKTYEGRPTAFIGRYNISLSDELADGPDWLSIPP